MESKRTGIVKTEDKRMKRKCVIFGTTDFGKMLRYYFEKYADVQIVAYTVDKAYLESAVSISSSMLQALKEEGHGVDIQTSGYNRPVVIKAYTGTIDKKYMKDKE